MKYIVLVGAFGGMGSAVAHALVESGYFVFALDRRVGEAEENLMPIEVDITDEASVSSAFERVRDVTDEVYAILNFAGIYTAGSLVEVGCEELARAYEINLFGVARINRIFLPLLREGSRIVITTSELAPLDPLPFTGIYALTKGALDKYAYSLRMELQLLGISVVVVRPGAVKTGMLGASTAALDEFCAKTTLYSYNAKRFKKIVDGVEARNIAPEKIGALAARILRVKRPKYVYSINRNPLLLLLNALPRRMQNFIIKKILKG